MGREERERLGSRRGQAMVEFVIALPILLFVIFGIIEFGRMTFAWLAVQNAARFGIRYAVTGEFKEEYCDEAGLYLGADWINADKDGGDPQDCLVPDSFVGATPDEGNEKEKDLIDIARLFSIRDAAQGGGTGLWLRPAVSGDYFQYLLNHDVTHIGSPGEDGFIHVTICSNREGNFGFDETNYVIPLCVEDPGGAQILMDDAGGPGDRVKVYVHHRHPLFLPVLSAVWPSVSLNAERDGIVEKFRTSRVLGVSGPILSAPTWTQTPTVTDTPTETLTPTITDTPTLVPTAFTCAGSGVLREYWHGIPGDNISDLTGDPLYPSAPSGNDIRGSFEGPVDWNDQYGTRMRAWLCLPEPGDYTFWIASDDDSSLRLDCSGSDPLVIGDANPGAAGQIAFVNGSTAYRQWDKYSSQRSGVQSVSSGGWICYLEAVHKEDFGSDNLSVAWDGPGLGGRQVIAGQYLSPLVAAPTSLPTDTPTVTPTPDCSKYSMTDFTFSNYAIQSLTVTNGDLVDAELDRIVFNWDFVENFGAVNGFPNVNVDWFSWDGPSIWGNGNNAPRDYSSMTDTSVDSSSSWTGPGAFAAGSSYVFSLDFDGVWGGSNSLPGVVSDDFGIAFHFDNGCILARGDVPRPVMSWTPSLTPTASDTPTPPPPPTDTLVPSLTFTPSDTPTATLTPTPSDTPTPTSTFTPTDTATITPTPSDTLPPTITPVPPSATPVPPSATPTTVPSSTPSPTFYFD